MLEKFDFIDNNGCKLYVRHIPSTTESNIAILFFNSRSLCVESSMGISMGTVSFGEFMANNGVHAFLVDCRGYGLSDSIQEQLVGNKDEITDPMTDQKYYSDILASVKYIKEKLGSNVKINALGFSIFGTILISMAHLYPGIFENLISLNPYWPVKPGDSFSLYKFTIEDPSLPFSETTLDKINQRLQKAQPSGKDFREELWFKEAGDSLKKYHRTFNQETQSWKLEKRKDHLADYIPFGKFENIISNLLMISSEFDSEHPLFLIKRFYERINIPNKKLQILPDATHLCIWEKSRHQLYKYTLDFIK